VLSKEQLLTATADIVGDDDRQAKLVDVFVCGVRGKLADIGIVLETVWGRGYRIVAGGRG
jgi:DNA-binding response OmpR family regulator